MAVAVQSRRRVPALALVSTRSSVVAGRLLVALVALSFAVRAVLGWLRATPVYFGDEYLYSSIAKAIAETGRPLVRGESAHFPALLQPIFTAPAWLVDDVGLAYHLAQTLGALAMSLAAIPAWWLARRLGLSAGVSFGIAALTLVLPDLVYASWMVAEPFAYPLALAAVAAAVAALERPSRRSQLAFVALTALAAFARIQFVVLPVCFVGALVVVGLRERRLRQAVREQLLALVLFALPLAATIALGPARVLAYYKEVVHVDVAPLAVVERSGMNLLVLLFSSGFVLVPGAALGLGLALARHRSRTELSFAAMTVFVLLALLAEAGIFGAFEQAQERYLFYVLPLVAVAFGLYASRGWPHRLFHALFAAVLVTVAAVVPLSGYAAADEKAHSPVLYGVFRVEQWLGSPGNGSLTVALAATVALAVLVVAASVRPRVAAAVGLSLAVALSAGLGAASVVFDHENSRAVRNAFLPADRSWVDHAPVGDVTLLRNIAGVRGGAFQQLFWNRSVKRLALMPGAPEIDAFRADRVQVADDGSLTAGGRPLTGDLLVDEHAVTTRFTGVTKVGSAPGYSLYRAHGRPRLFLFFLARFDDGWLGDRGTINLWPTAGDRLEGTLVFDVESPAPLEATTLDLQLPSGRQVHVAVPAGGSTRVELPVCSRTPWATGFRSKIRAFVQERAVSVKAGVPRFVPGSEGCTGKRVEVRPAPPRATA